MIPLWFLLYAVACGMRKPDGRGASVPPSNGFFVRPTVLQDLRRQRRGMDEISAPC
jgi:hypothetical protein